MPAATHSEPFSKICTHRKKICFACTELNGLVDLSQCRLQPPVFKNGTATENKRTTSVQYGFKEENRTLVPLRVGGAYKIIPSIALLGVSLSQEVVSLELSYIIATLHSRASINCAQFHQDSNPPYFSSNVGNRAKR